MTPGDQRPAFLVDGEERSPITFVFAHGAGGPMDSPFMKTVAAGLAKRGVRVVRFEFPYMAARPTGTRKGPDRPEELRKSWLETIEAVRGQRGGKIAIGGKSMGGRIASLVA